MRQTVVLDVVGLTHGMIGPQTPTLQALAQKGGLRPLQTICPAVTCSVQSTFLTGLLPREHGIVGNGWYARDLAEVLFWKQSNHLVTGEKIWEAARKRDASFTCAQLFWWFNMYASVDWSVTPRPIYWADGSKTPDIYTQPTSLRDELREHFGDFPLFNFWGPGADIQSSHWIAAAARYVFDQKKPTLTLVYLPHLDYDLQRFGPHDTRSVSALNAVDALCGELIEHFSQAGARVLVLSEYGITSVSKDVPINRVLREAGLLVVREERGLEKLDPGASEAFAVADHQVAHVYVRQPETKASVCALLMQVSGIESVWDSEQKHAFGLDHPRAGDLVAVAAPDHWFSYPYWLDDNRAPEFARTVDIHRKPGYDPLELFLDSSLHFPQLYVGAKLLQKWLGFRMLMDVIPLDASLVRGSHGRLPTGNAETPIFLSSEPALVDTPTVAATAVKDLILRHIFE